jgi:hypothetical protein
LDILLIAVSSMLVNQLLAGTRADIAVPTEWRLNLCAAGKSSAAAKGRHERTRAMARSPAGRAT